MQQKFLWIYDFCFKCSLSETFWVLIFLWQTLCSLVSSAQGLVNCSVLFLVLWLLHFLMDSLCPVPNKMLICPWGRIWVRILRRRTTKVSLFMEKRSPNPCSREHEKQIGLSVHLSLFWPARGQTTILLVPNSKFFCYMWMMMCTGRDRHNNPISQS